MVAGFVAGFVVGSAEGFFVGVAEGLVVGLFVAGSDVAGFVVAGLLVDGRLVAGLVVAGVVLGAEVVVEAAVPGAAGVVVLVVLVMLVVFAVGVSARLRSDESSEPELHADRARIAVTATTMGMRVVFMWWCLSDPKVEMVRVRSPRDPGAGPGPCTPSDAGRARGVAEPV